MTELLSRVRDYFVELDEPEAAPPVLRRRRVVPESVGLLGPARLTAATGAALALTLARLHGSRCAIVCRFAERSSSEGPAAELASRAGGGGGAPAVPAARRAAAALRAQELRAEAAGRLVRVTLDEDTAVVATSATLAMATASGPAVLVVDRARDDGIDRALAQQDALAWLAPEDVQAGLTALVTQSLEALGPPVLSVRAPSALARRLASAGVLAPGLTTSLLAELDGAAA